MKRDTRLTRTGQETRGAEGPINPSIVRASTLRFSSLERMRDVRARRDTGERIFSYGARGTPTAFELEDALCELEGGARSFLYPSGLCGIGSVFLAILGAGDHVAVVDTVYPPVRKFCERVLKRNRVGVSFFAPGVRSLEAVLRTDTRLVYAESPGFGTFEILDIPAIAELTKRRSIPLCVDNTWSAGYFCQPLALGADIAVQAVTKYICGYSDLMMGAVVATEQWWRPLHEFGTDLGICVSPDDAYIALRGLRSLSARLRRHEENGLRLATVLSESDEVERVLHPAFPSCPGHEIWKRDFSGASGLFSIALRPDLVDKSDQFVESLRLFGLGSSWGGYQSLVLPIDPSPLRTATAWTGARRLVRISAGLEDPDDLIEDLKTALAAIA